MGGGQVSRASVFIVLMVHFQRKPSCPMHPYSFLKEHVFLKKALSPATTPTPMIKKRTKEKTTPGMPSETGHRPSSHVYPAITLRNLTALQVHLKDSTAVCSLCLLSPPVLQTHELCVTQATQHQAVLLRLPLRLSLKVPGPPPSGFSSPCDP